MTDQPRRVTPARSATCSTRPATSPRCAAGRAGHLPRAESHLLSRIAADLDTAEAHQVAADAWHHVRALARRDDQAGGDPVKMSTFSGEQLAQVNNPDPFAPPVWRSPVYHTPGWVITIVQLRRLLIALIAFLPATRR